MTREGLCGGGGERFGGRTVSKVVGLAVAYDGGRSDQLAHVVKVGVA